MEASNPDGEYRDAALAARWRRSVVLKRDLFSTVERGYFRAADGEIDAVMRRIDRVPWWTRPVARHFLKREARALTCYLCRDLEGSQDYIDPAAEHARQ